MPRRLLLSISAFALAATPALAQSTPDLIPGIGSAYPNRNMQGDTKWAPTVDQWDALTKYKLDFTSTSMANFAGLTSPNTFTASNTFSVNPQLSACVGYPYSGGATPLSCATTIPGTALATGAAGQNISASQQTVAIPQPNLVTTNTTGGAGSVGQGAINAQATRTNGYGEYGHILSLLTVSPSVAVPIGQFDVAMTGWSTNTNDNGGQIFGSWFGANTPAGNLGEAFAAGQAIGAEINYGNRWTDLGLYTSLGGIRQTIGLQIVPDVLPATDGVNSLPIAMTCASPSVFTWNANGLSNNYGMVLGGTPCTGFTAGTTYYVVNATTNTFQLSATLGGSAINGTGASNSVTALASWPGTFGQVISPSVHGHETWVGTLIVPDAIVAGGHAHYDRGGSVPSNAPLDWANVQGYWTNGLDLSGAAFSTYNAITVGQYQVIYGGSYIGTATNVSTNPTSGALRTAGGLGVAGNAYIGGVVNTGGYTVAALPASPGAGARAYVTDASACATRLGALTGGGSTFCPTVYNGTTWVQQ